MERELPIPARLDAGSPDPDRQRESGDIDHGDPARDARRGVRPVAAARPVTYSVQGEKTSPPFARAFALGCGGVAVPHTHGFYDGPIAAFGTPPTWPLFDRAIHRGDDWYYGDHGLFRRFKYFRVTKNAMQHDGFGQATDQRFRQLRVDLHPHWRAGRTIVVCPNSPVYMRRFGLNADAWAQHIVERLQTLTGRPVLLRWKRDADQRPLRVDLQDAFLVVAYSSAAAVEALAAGVPVCTLAPWASTARMGITDLANANQPYYPDLGERDQFLFNLADHQWTLDEIEAGHAWKALNP